jgi:hypothetical protein
MSDAPPPNDPSIPDGAKLYRRIPRMQIVPDDSVPDGRRPESGNFDELEMSAVLASECTIEALLTNHESYGVACFKVGEIRALGWGVVRAPNPDLPGHVHIMGNTGKKNGNYGKRRTLAKTCRMIRYPPPIS